MDSSLWSIIPEIFLFCIYTGNGPGFKITELRMIYLVPDLI